MKKRIVLLLATILMSLAGFSQGVDKAKLDAYFDTLANNNKFMGSVAVSQDGKLIYTKAIGFSNEESKEKATENTTYRIGSISKTFTAVLVFKAIEENKLSLNQTIDRFFPEIENAGKITITHLLYHRSGIRNYTDNDWLTWRTQHKTEQEMVAIIAKGGSDFAPDTKTGYSNSNFALLTYILEKIHQKPYAEIVDEKIIKPAGLKNTRYGGKINVTNNESHSYKYGEKGWQKAPETDVSQLLGAGGIISTPTDLILFSHALFNKKLVSENSLTQMTTIKEHAGMGLFPMPFYYRSGFGHTGGIDGFSSMFAYFPAGKISFAFTSNGIDYNGNDIAIAVLSAVYGEAFEIPTFTTYQVTDEELDQYLGVYSSKQHPLKMTITKANGRLTGQGTGQSSFPLEASAKDRFKFEQAGVVLEFNPAEKTMVLKQGGGTFLFIREE